MDLQINIFLLLFGGLQGILFWLFLIKKKLFSSAYIFLMLYLAAMVLQLTLKLMSKIWLMENWPVLYSFSHYLPILYGPLAFLFVKHLLRNSAFERKELAHFVPALVFISLIIIENYRQLPLALEFILFHPAMRFSTLLISLIAYHLLAIQLWTRRQRNLQSFFSENLMVQIKWVKRFILVSLFTGMLLTTALYLLYINYPNGHQYRYGFVALSICIYWFSYTALTQPAVFSVVKGYAKDDIETDSPLPQLKVYKKNSKYSNSCITDEQVQRICKSLEQVMAEKKLFLQPNLTINQLADEVNCTRHHLSQVLNDKLQKSYYDYINSLRIEEAGNLLILPGYRKHTIASIAYDAGFSSLSTFNEVFKKHTGKTPSEYKKELLKECQQRRV